ncbi:LTA synthase family protein [Leucobacter tenebrionis]|uniref:LTA synthase family protein n=1 Tax=Leucobacter tenebrionis TaxID=2873270 RepID=UPI001CA6FE03|nr:LTA synthase family protein [Leucobacter tenebrionis]QZY51153.1 LTA synthase family protein [Leucobacter tenebrionis]
MTSEDRDAVPSTAPPAQGEPLSAATPAAPSRRSRLLWGVAIVGFWLLVLTGAILIGAALWVLRTFGPLSVDQLLMNIPGGEGAGGDGLVRGAVVSILLIPAGIVLVLALLCEKSRRELRRGGVLRPRCRRVLLRGIAAVLAVVVPVGGAVAFGSTIGAGAYLQSYAREASGEATLADYYVVPRYGMAANTQGGPGMRSDPSGASERRNLVVIYLESVEDSFSDDRTFEKNMLEPVQQATAGWDSIPSFRQYDGGGWTMSGIVSTQCGIPLRTAGSLADATTLNSIGADGATPESYLPGATCLGDVLAREGYRNVFMGGADASFAGKGSFLETHGYDEVHDLREWRELGETEVRDDWGLSDRRLFERAREEVTRLHEQEQPFNLTMLTLDTHEGPRVYEYCDWDTEVAMTSITSCSMQQVAGFVDYLDETGVLEDTTVVLMGDHLKMIAEGGSFWEELKDREDRTIFNRIRTPEGVEIVRDDIDQFSMYPTLIELAGIELEDHRAGVGVSALAGPEDVPPGTILDLDAQEYRALVKSRAAEFYRELWGE